MFTMIKANKGLLFFFYISTLIIFFFSSKFSPLYNFNYWADINIYYTIGKSIWYDKIIYKDLFDHKGPLIFFIYSLGSLLSSPKFLGMFLVQTCFHFVAVVYVYRALRLFLNKGYIPILLSLFSFSFLLNFSLEGGSAEEFVFSFQVISLYYFLRFFKKDNCIHNPKNMFIYGLLLTCTFYIKLNLILFWFFPLLSIFITLFINKQYKSILDNLLGLLSGVFLVSILILGYFYFNDAVSDFWEAYIMFNYLYSKQIVFEFKDFLLEYYFKFRRDYIIFIILFSGIVFPLLSSLIKNKLGKVSLLLSFCLVSILMVPNSIHLHYYLIPLMPYSLLGLILIGLFLEKCFFKYKLRLNTFVFLVIFFVSIAFISSRKAFFNYSFETLYTRNFPETSVEKFSSIIKMDDDLSLLVLDIGSGLPVFTASDIVPDIKYFFYPNIAYELYPTLRNSHTQYIENKITKYVILDRREDSQLYDRFLPQYYNLIDEFVAPNGNISLLYERK